jgi:hypothetical protein
VGKQPKINTAVRRAFAEEQERSLQVRVIDPGYRLACGDKRATKERRNFLLVAQCALQFIVFSERVPTDVPLARPEVLDRDPTAPSRRPIQEA